MVSKEEAGYEENGGGGGSRCDECVNYLEPDRCRLVEGDINSDGICQLFEKDVYKTAAQIIRASFMNKFAGIHGSVIAYDSGGASDGVQHEDPALKRAERSIKAQPRPRSNSKGVESR